MKNYSTLIIEKLKLVAPAIEIDNRSPIKNNYCTIMKNNYST